MCAHGRPIILAFGGGSKFGTFLEILPCYPCPVLQILARINILNFGNFQGIPDGRILGPFWELAVPSEIQVALCGVSEQECALLAP